MQELKELSHGHTPILTMGTVVLASESETLFYLLLCAQHIALGLACVRWPYPLGPLLTSALQGR